MFENIAKFFKKLVKAEKKESPSKDTAKERLHLVLMQDRANVSADFLELMKQEIIEVIKKYIEVDESAIDVRLTNETLDDGTNGAPSLYANIPIKNIKNGIKGEEKQEKKDNSVEKKEEEKNNSEDKANGEKEEQKQSKEEEKVENEQKENKENKEEKKEENKEEREKENKHEEKPKDEEKIEEKNEQEENDKSENVEEKNEPIQAKEEIEESNKNN